MTLTSSAPARATVIVSITIALGALLTTSPVLTADSFSFVSSIVFGNVASNRDADGTERRYRGTCTALTGSNITAAANRTCLHPTHEQVAFDRFILAMDLAGVSL